jgi:hypothetical protein
MSDINPSVLWKRKPDCDVEYCTNWSDGTGVTLLMVSQYVMLQTHTMLPVSNSRGTHGLSASPESNIWKWYHLIYNIYIYIYIYTYTHTHIYSFIHSFIMHSVNPYMVNRPIGYRNLSQYKMYYSH